MKDITTTLFRVPAYGISPVGGSMLVAEPFTDERYYFHGVVSVIDYLAGEGATGVVMNNLTDYTLPELLDGVNADIKVPVYCGGPSGQDRIFFIHTLGSDIIPGAREYAPGLYVGGDFDAIVNYINSGYPVDGVVRFFIGYCSWCEGELEREIAHDSWALAPDGLAPEDALTGGSDRYWHRLVRSLGPRYRSWQLIPRNADYN
ncbi:MAG: YqgE/AlgH family protein [Muribaculaceae bacterium]|nr:YqgE/AlgH family protein [Bacteroidales bacterium]MDE6437688.1 YqgE/AlgH family protein [Muribaculaceae bacterium]